jgi:hypothetical protein
LPGVVEFENVGAVTDPAGGAGMLVGTNLAVLTCCADASRGLDEASTPANTPGRATVRINAAGRRLTIADPLSH